jgi:hypothetical protein
MRSITRAAIVAALLAAAAPIGAAHAAPPPPPYSCHIYWIPVAQTSPNLPPVTIYVPQIVCYG